MFTDIAYLCFLSAFILLLCHLGFLMCRPLCAMGQNRQRHDHHMKENDGPLPAPENSGWMHAGIPHLSFWVISLAGILFLSCFLCILYSFYSGDMSSEIVRGHSHILDPLWIKLSALWAGHEGSMLLVSLYMGGFLWYESRHIAGNQVNNQGKNQENNQENNSPHIYAFLVMLLNVIIVMFGVLFFFDPFVRSPSHILAGVGLNPLLQDISMVIHPPILLASYGLSSVIFARACGCLLFLQTKSRQNVVCREDQDVGAVSLSFKTLLKMVFDHILPAVRIYWFFCTMALMLGSFWAFYELGWGGFWFWDPVENISLWGWLCASIILHSHALLRHSSSVKNKVQPNQALQESQPLLNAGSKGKSKIIIENYIIYGAIYFAVFLSMGLWPLILNGSGIIRSGLLGSVHSFALSPEKSLFFICASLGFISFGMWALYHSSLWSIMKQACLHHHRQTGQIVHKDQDASHGCLQNAQNVAQNSSHSAISPLSIWPIIFCIILLLAVFIILFLSGQLPVIGWLVSGKSIHIDEEWFHMVLNPLLFVLTINIVFLFISIKKVPYGIIYRPVFWLLLQGALLVMAYILDPLILLCILILVLLFMLGTWIKIMVAFWRGQKREHYVMPKVIAIYGLHLCVVFMAMSMASSQIGSIEKTVIFPRHQGDIAKVDDAETTVKGSAAVAFIDFHDEFLTVIPDALRPFPYFSATLGDFMWNDNHQSISAYIKAGLHPAKQYHQPITTAELRHYIVQDTSTAEVGLYHDFIYCYYVTLQQYPTGDFALSVKIMPLAGWIWVFASFILFFYICFYAAVMIRRRQSRDIYFSQKRKKSHALKQAIIMIGIYVMVTVFFVGVYGFFAKERLAIPTISRFDQKIKTLSDQEIKRLIAQIEIYQTALLQSENDLQQARAEKSSSQEVNILRAHVILWKKMMDIYLQLGDYHNAALSMQQVKKIIRQIDQLAL
jgi:cytochrome c biogenesis factor